MLGHKLGMHVYLHDINIATCDSEERHWNEDRWGLEVSDANNSAVKWSKCTFFIKKTE